MGGKSGTFNSCATSGTSGQVTPDQFLMVLNLQLNGPTIPETLKSNIQTQIDQSPALKKLQQEIGPCDAGQGGNVINTYGMLGMANLMTGHVNPNAGEMSGLSLQAHNILTLCGISDDGETSKNLGAAAISFAMTSNTPEVKAAPRHSTPPARTVQAGSIDVPAPVPAPEKTQQTAGYPAGYFAGAGLSQK
jgi:hypothetical protein